ncbi:MAG TPA: PaaX family transcriptional regulator C-terminal domain-containing protein [Nocardioidaceae bacterium]|jgi:phenylacetic acid degradation operon negative regulatory protein
MHARSALFDLYGDHLRTRGGRAPVAALVRMLAPLDITPAAVRTAVSRMVRQGWLEPVNLAGGRGYALTERARQRLDDAASRIYRTREAAWDGTWDMLVLEPVPNRAARERVRAGLGFLGYAPLSESTWISPYASPEAMQVLGAEHARAARFQARDDDPAARAARAWDLGTLGAAYAAWHRDAVKLVTDPASVLGDVPAGEEEQAFAVRSLLVHEWRKFLFRDPGLPAELLPADWPGHAAASLFDEQTARLLPAASRFVDGCLAQDRPRARTPTPSAPNRPQENA